MHKILLMALQRNIRHFDRLLDDLEMGSLKKSLSQMWVLRDFFQQMVWSETA